MKVVLREEDDIETYLPSIQEVEDAILDENDKKVFHLEMANFTDDSALIEKIRKNLQEYLQRNLSIEYIYVELHDYLGDDPDNLSNSCLSLIADFINTYNTIVRLSIEASRDRKSSGAECNFDGAGFLCLLYHFLRKKPVGQSRLNYISLENLNLSDSASCYLRSLLALNQLEALTLKGSRLHTGYLLEGLEKNTALKMLDLGKVRGFHQGDGIRLANALKKHLILALLSLHQVNFRDKDAQAIASMLKTNSTLQYLDFTNAFLERDELIYFARALAQNSELKILILSAGENSGIQINLTPLNTSAVCFGEAFKRNNTLIYCDLMRSCLNSAGKGRQALIDGFSQSASLIFLFSKDTKEGEWFKELSTISSEKYAGLKSKEDLSDLDRRWIELCKQHTDNLADIPLACIAGSVGLVESSLIPEWPLLSLSTEGALSSSSSSASEFQGDKGKDESEQSRGYEGKKRGANTQSDTQSGFFVSATKLSHRPTKRCRREERPENEISWTPVDLDRQSPSPSRC